MAWIRGETGSPFNRQGILKANAFQKLCQEYAPTAFSLIREIVENPLQEGSVRIQGLKFMVEHAYGKARQSIDLKAEEPIDPGMMSQSQLMLAAAGQTEELVCSLIESGKLDEYRRRYEGVVPRIEKDITEVKDDHLGETPKAKPKPQPKPKLKAIPKKPTKKVGKGG
jgi:hypothetical protein